MKYEVYNTSGKTPQETKALVCLQTLTFDVTCSTSRRDWKLAQVERRSDSAGNARRSAEKSAGSTHRLWSRNRRSPTRCRRQPTGDAVCLILTRLSFASRSFLTFDL